ncbi:MAG: class I SAM-dependent methyltransferase [Hyphomicrobiales bacterium]|nr:class I SAM-dependent methyltransferase [Hyphomicrobiales bacterium]
MLADLLRHWQKTINLVSPPSLQHLWLRHIADSAQVIRLAPDARCWLDFGSGAGFPGLVAAILRRNVTGSVTHLVESDQRKCAFLREVSRETHVNCQIHNMRIELFDADAALRPDVVSARALAALPLLMGYAEKYLLMGALGLFPKGQHIGVELTKVATDSRFSFDKRRSITDDLAQIVLVKARN